MKIWQHLKKHIFLYILLFFVVVSISISYVRFIINDDYIVSYEGTCDPYTSVCFVGCKDDECIETYYYLKMQKKASDLYSQCGKDITNCSLKNICATNEQGCSVAYCDADIDGDACETITEESNASDGVPLYDNDEKL